MAGGGGGGGGRSSNDGSTDGGGGGIAAAAAAAAAVEPQQDLWEKLLRRLGDTDPDQMVTGVLFNYSGQFVAYLEVQFKIFISD